jgi:hypothetical protein
LFEDSLPQVSGHTDVQRAAAARHAESEIEAFMQVSILLICTWAGSGEGMQLRILPLRVRMTAAMRGELVIFQAGIGFLRQDRDFLGKKVFLP